MSANELAITFCSLIGHLRAVGAMQQRHFSLGCECDCVAAADESIGSPGAQVDHSNQEVISFQVSKCRSQQVVRSSRRARLARRASGRLVANSNHLPDD
jgi:hypothetical protein